MRIPIIKIRVKRRKSFTAYQLDYTYNGKRIREVVADTRADAEKIRAKRVTDLMLGRQGIFPPSSNSISLKGLTDQYLARKNGIVRTTTYKRYVNYFDGLNMFMKKYFPEVIEDIRQIKSHYFQECFKQLTREKVLKNKPWHPNTVNILRDLLAEMFTQAIKDNYIDSNPLQNTSAFKVPHKNTLKFYTDEQLGTIWKNLAKEWLPIFKFLYFTGLRKNEMINLIWENVSLNKDNPTITITSTEEFQTKSGRSHIIRISQKALEILKGQQGKHPKYVFPGNNKKRMRKADPNEALNDALTNTGITGTVHMFRHTFASHFMMKGVGSIYDLSEYLSHADIESTKIYAHLSPTHKKDITDKMDLYQK